MKIKRYKSTAIALETAKQHNKLDEITRNGFDQVSGQLTTIKQVFEQMQNRIMALEKDVRLLSFYIGRGRVETNTMKYCISQNLPMEKYQEIFDNLLRRDFLVDSNNTPVATVGITEYN
jgi:hypothetical protein